MENVRRSVGAGEEEGGMWGPGACPSSPGDSFGFCEMDGLYAHEGQAPGPHPSASSAPCPYRRGTMSFNFPIRLSNIVRAGRKPPSQCEACLRYSGFASFVRLLDEMRHQAFPGFFAAQVIDGDACQPG